MPSKFGITSSEITPSGWEDAEFPLSEAEEEPDILSEDWELSEPEASEESEASEEPELPDETELSGLELPDVLPVLEDTEDDIDPDETEDDVEEPD